MDYFAFQWHITDNCDQRCQHCYIFSEGKHLELSEMSWTEMLDVFENCRDMCKKANRLPYFYLTGGDPILHSRFWDLIDLFKLNNIPFTILGNPFHLNDSVCKRLRGSGCERYQLSIDGLKETHDTMRKRGSFDTTIEKLKCLHNAGIRSAIMMTVSGTNSDELPEIIDLVVENKVNVFAFARYAPTSFEKSTHLTPERYRELLEVCWRKFEQYKDSATSFNLKDHLWTLFLHEKGLFKIPADLNEDVIYEGCNCGNCHLTILPKGEVYACRRFESKIGNAFTESLYDIFTGEKMEAYRHFSEFEKCSSCALKRFCRGCPAVTYGYTGSFYGTDPQCWKKLAG